MTRARSVLLVLLVGIALPACGPGGLSLPSSLGGADPTALDAPHTVEVDPDGTADPTGPTDVRPAVGEAVDPDAYRAHIEAGMAEVASLRMVADTVVEGVTLRTVTVADSSRAEPRMQVTTTTPEGELVIRVVGTRAWARGTDLGTSSTWVSVDPTDPDDPLAPRVTPMVDALARGEAGNAALAPDIESVTYLGVDLVDGIEPVLDHYRVETPTASMGGMMGLGPDEVADLTAALGPTTTSEAWVDSSGRGRRSTSSVAGVDTTMTTDRFGADFGIEVPDPDDVITMDQALEQVLGAG